MKVDKCDRALIMVEDELRSAMNKFKKFNSSHEGYGVLKEELEELWEEIKKKRSRRNKKILLNEAKQISAMGLRFMIDICGDEIEKE